MPKYYLVVSSVTTAQRLQKLCQKQGLSLSVVHTPQELTPKGCSYSLIVAVRDYEKVNSLSTEYGIAIRDRFLFEDGRFQKI